MDIRIDLGRDGIKGILLYAYDAYEREKALQALLDINPELKRIDEKLVGTRSKNSGR